ncbi:MAG: tetratricopeptide repeat protein [Flavobacteriales bacterium]|nr:tetratricopeptide repeat protein [Flavobacteriales bacterium]
MSKHTEEHTEPIVDVQEVYSKTEHFIDKNKKRLSIVVLAIIVVVGGYIGYKKLIIAPQELEAQSAMFMAEKYFAQDSLQLAINGDGEHYGFIDIVDIYSGTKAANLSHYYLGIAYRNTGDYEMAIDELKSFSSDDIMISAVALGAIGDCYMELDDLEQAISYYEKAAGKNENGLTSPIFLFKAGMAYEDLQDFAAAGEKYKAIKNNYPDSRESQTIDKYIARVEALIQ